MSSKKLIVFSAPSGAGKTTLVKYLLSQFNNIEFSISATSRKIRGSENGELWPPLHPQVGAPNR